MKTSRTWLRPKQAALAMAITLLIAALIYGGKAWTDARATPPAYIKMRERAANPWNQRMIDSGIGLLRTGDLVVRTGGDVTSYMLSQLNLHDKTYSHCGIVMVENGYPFVYHSIGGEDNPNECLRRDSAAFWFSPMHNLGYGIVRFNLDGPETAALSLAVARYYREKKKFDLDFDLSTDDKLYCAEFAYRALNQAFADSSFIGSYTMFGYRYVAVDNLTLSPHARFIWQIQYK